MNVADHDLMDTRAPDFMLEASLGRTVRRDDYKGRLLLLYFYPKADTPGCTVQARAIEEALPQLGELRLDVIGVSPDPVAKLDRFAASSGLSFPLASDPDHAVADAFGVWVEKSMYGRTYWGMERSSFLLDGQGVIRKLWRKVKPAQHAALVQAAAAALGR